MNRESAKGQKHKADKGRGTGKVVDGMILMVS
jgi:hypothetical protein